MVGTPRKPHPTAHSAQLSPAPTAAAQHLASLSLGQLAGPQLSLPPSHASTWTLGDPCVLESNLLPAFPLWSASDSLGPWQGARMEKRLYSVLFTAFEGNFEFPRGPFVWPHLLQGIAPTFVHGLQLGGQGEPS